jgi:hypothetical protein
MMKLKHLSPFLSRVPSYRRFAALSERLLMRPKPGLDAGRILRKLAAEEVLYGAVNAPFLSDDKSHFYGAQFPFQPTEGDLRDPSHPSEVEQ